MSSELLRRAAEKLREHANAATPGQWVVEHDDEAMLFNLCTDASTDFRWQREIVSVHTPDASWPDLDYFACVHPPVALALADWLSFASIEADHAERATANYFRAVAVARAILREDDD